tara:strand:- start:156 stop:311 length:156 start_codon:yes stop_codon:yes gene_type:complete
MEMLLNLSYKIRVDKTNNEEVHLIIDETHSFALVIDKALFSIIDKVHFRTL